MPTARVNFVDWIAIALYASSLAAIALYHSRKIRRQDDVFVAGRSMTGWPIAISMYMALFSTNTFLGYTGWVNRPNGTVWVGLQTVGIVLAVPFVVWLYPALFFRLKVISAYEYLSLRFDDRVRLFATAFFLLSRIAWMSTMLYSASLVISTMLGWSGLSLAIVLIGGFGAMFAFAGGMHAVIWTDVVQFFFLLAGLIAMIVLGAAEAGGFGAVLSTASEAGKFAPPELFSLTSEVSLASGLLLGFIGMMSSAGADQVVMQQYLTARSAEVAKSSLWRNGLFLKPVSLVYPFLGLILFAYYRAHPETAALMRQPDDALPVFVMNVLPPGARGIMVVALMSAVVTSLESGMAAVSAAVQVDIVKRRGALSEEAGVRLARALLLASAAVIVGAALFVQRLGSTHNIIQILNILMYPFAGVLLGIFLLGLLSLRANGNGVLIGAAAGFLITIAVPLSKFAGVKGLGALASVSTFYYGFLGAAATLVLGAAASGFFPAPRRDQLEGLTRR